MGSRHANETPDPLFRPAPFSRFYVELHGSCGSHPDKQFLQRLCALVARIDPLLQRIKCAGLVERGEYIVFIRHNRSLEQTDWRVGD